MQNLSALMRKEHLKKGINSKYNTPTTRPDVSPYLNPSTLMTASLKPKPKKTKSVRRSLLLDRPQAKKDSSKNSAKHTQSTGAATTKAPIKTKRSPSKRNGSPSKNKKDKLKRKFEEYAPAKSESRNLAAQCVETTKSYFPLTHE
jgi:hypothetical protein